MYRSEDMYGMGQTEWEEMMSLHDEYEYGLSAEAEKRMRDKKAQEEAEKIEDEIINGDILEEVRYRGMNTPDAATLAKRPYQRVFVYGTLMRNQGNHRLLKDSIYLGPAETRDAHFRMQRTSGFPVVSKTDVQNYKGIILGEAYAVNLDTMRGLDCLEANGSMYQRKEVPVIITEQRTSFQRDCWMYHSVDGFWGSGSLENTPRTWDSVKRKHYYRFL